MPSSSYDVAIVGAGPVGLSLATLLSNNGVNTILLEANDTIATESRASTFHPPTLEMLSTIDAAQPLIDNGVVVRDWQFRLHPEGTRAVFDMSVLDDETAFACRLQVEQAVLCRILLDKLTRSGKVDLRFGSEVVAVEQTDDGTAVTFVKAGETSKVTASYVIGCDGSHSVVRKSIGLSFEGSTYGDSTILITTPFAFENHLEGLSPVSYCFNQRGGMFTVIKVPAYWRLSFYPRDGETIDQATQPESIQAVLNGIVPSDKPFEITGARVYRAHQRIVESYRKGRILLAGDAAHVHAAAGGTGMNGGIHDAFCLAEYLVPVVKRTMQQSMLDMYERRRREVTIDEIMPTADRARKVIYERDPARRDENIRNLQSITSDRAKMKDYLMKASMISGVRKSEKIGKEFA